MSVSQDPPAAAVDPPPAALGSPTGVDRSAEALDRLVRRAEVGGRSGPGGPDWSTLLRRPTVVVAVIVIALVVVLVVTQRRPGAVDDRLPRASASAPTASSSAPPTSSATGAPPGPPPGGPSGAAPDARIVVHVAGAVSNPGVVELPASSRVVDAVQAAGGLRADADPDRVNLAAPLADGHRIVIPIIGQPVPPEVAAVPPTGDPGASGGSASGGSASGSAGGAAIDLNTADAARLEELPGVGPATAAAIIAHREKEGPFTSVDGLIDVRGIGEAKLEALRDLVTVGG